MRYLKLSAIIVGLIVSAGVLGVLKAKELRVKPGEPVRAAADDGEFIMHEWGTFTTFSGSDGVFLEYRPLAQQHADLPGFVWDRSTSSRSGMPVFSKRRVSARVRMETPVAYFYTDRVRSVNVNVDFPKGMLTEFYPPARVVLPQFDPKTAYGDGETIGNSSLDWGRVDLIPTERLVPDVADEELRDKLIADMVAQLLPSSRGNDHYGAARATDSALVRIERDNTFAKHDEMSQSLSVNPESYFEKFLFYRGVGKFTLPYAATYSNDTVSLANNGDMPMNAAILIDADGDKIRAAKIGRVDAGKSIPFPNTEPVSEDALCELVQQSLVDEGLYAKEAAAMVNTWRKSWFTENGTRVLYMVPPKLTDELIPLQISPAPKESLRVLVGRMEIMSPADEKKMADAVAESAAHRKAFFANKNRDPKVSYAIPKSISNFGRMTEPALARVAALATNDVVRNETASLISQLRAIDFADRPNFSNGLGFQP